MSLLGLKPPSSAFQLCLELNSVFFPGWQNEHILEATYLWPLSLSSWNIPKSSPWQSFCTSHPLSLEWSLPCLCLAGTSFTTNSQCTCSFPGESSLGHSVYGHTFLFSAHHCYIWYFCICIYLVFFHLLLGHKLWVCWDLLLYFIFCQELNK